MLDKDNVMSRSVSEAVEKIPTDEKDYRKCLFMCLFCIATLVTKSGPTYS